MSEEKIDAIEKIGSSAGKKQKVVRAPNEDHFQALMQQVQPPPPAAAEVANTTGVEEVRKPSLEDEVRNLGRQVDRATTRTPDELVAQAEDILKKIGDIKDKLQQPDIQIKQDYQRQLQSKLQHIDDSLKVALDKAGVEYTDMDVEQKAKPTLMNPIEKFLGFLTDGQSKLETLAAEVRGWSDKKDEISPAGMLLVQIKVMQISNQLELFTNLLSKGLESTKTLMNVQV